MMENPSKPVHLFPAESPQYALEKKESFNHEVFRTKEASNYVIH